MRGFHNDSDIRPDDSAPERGHPLPVVDGGVGVGDGDGGGGGVGEGELVVGEESDGNCRGRSVLWKKRTRMRVAGRRWHVVLVVFGRLRDLRRDRFRRDGRWRRRRREGGNMLDHFLRYRMPVRDELEVIRKAGFGGSGQREARGPPDTGFVLVFFAEKVRKVFDDGVDGLAVLAVDCDDGASGGVLRGGGTGRRERRGDLGEDFDFVNVRDRHYHGFDRFGLRGGGFRYTGGL